MSLADRIRSRPANRTPPGPKPGMIQLLDALGDEDRQALEGLIMNEAVSATEINTILASESEELKKQAEATEDAEERYRLECLADLHVISAFTIGRFRRQVRAGTHGVF